MHTLSRINPLNIGGMENDITMEVPPFDVILDPPTCSLFLLDPLIYIVALLGPLWYHYCHNLSIKPCGLCHQHGVLRKRLLLTSYQLVACIVHHDTKMGASTVVVKDKKQRSNKRKKKKWNKEWQDKGKGKGKRRGIGKIINSLK